MGVITYFLSALIQNPRNLMPIHDSLLLQRVKNLITNNLLTKTDYNLGNVDNTPDDQKPVSGPQQAAIDLKLNVSSVNSVNGVAGLDGTGKILVSKLPAINISSLADVQISSASDAQVLSFNAGSQKWQNSTTTGGSGTLNQTEIVAGVGESTSNPQTVTLRGPTGSGINVRPGNLILQPPLGTGSYGSGNTVIQGSAEQNTVSMAYYLSTSRSTVLSSATHELVFPPLTGALKNTTLVLQIIARPATTMTPSIPGVPLTLLYSTNAQGMTMAVYYSQNVTQTGAKTLTISNSPSAGTYVISNFLESANIPDTPTVSTFTNATSSSVVVSTAPTESDLVYDMVLCGTNTSTAPIETMPNNQTPLLQYSTNQAFSATSPYSYLSISYSYGTSGSTMARTYSAAVSGTHIAIRITSQRPPSSSVATTTDVLTITNGTFISRPFPAQVTETTADISGVYAIKIIKPNSARCQIINSTENTTSFYRLVILPRADCLPLGTTFFFMTNSNTKTSICIAPYSSQVLSLSASNNLYYNSSIPGINPFYIINDSNAAYSRLAATLINNANPKGLWQYNYTTRDGSSRVDVQ